MNHTFEWRSLTKIILQKIDYFEEKEKDNKVVVMDMALLNKSKLNVVDQEVLLYYKYFTLFEILIETIDQNPGGGDLAFYFFNILLLNFS